MKIRNKTRIITIDGPAGSGKTTVSKAIAARLGCVYVDTGALYRGVAYEVFRCNVNWQDDSELEALLSSIEFEFRLQPEGTFRLFSSGQDITDYIRTPEITMLSSDVSAQSTVRQALLDFQREIAMNSDAVFEGRDMGTVVFPNADHKFFLFADLHTRALRRYNETLLKECSQTSQTDKINIIQTDKTNTIQTDKTNTIQTDKTNTIQTDKTNTTQTDQINTTQTDRAIVIKKVPSQTLDEIKSSIALRDKNDSSRDIAPLKQAEDAIMIDSTHLNPEQVVNKIMHYIRH